MGSGLSKRIHLNLNDTFEIKGPLGKGLEIKNGGVHIAFTAGTGLLPFIDLVAHLIRKKLNLLKENEKDNINDTDFKFVLYVSFHNETESIALKML